MENNGSFEEFLVMRKLISTIQSLTIRFLFIFGWLRVAETLYNPFGEDDEDFELNELLNRHFKVAMTIVDENEDHPELKKDIFWNQDDPELIEHPELDVDDGLNDLKEDFIFK